MLEDGGTGGLGAPGAAATVLPGLGLPQAHSTCRPGLGREGLFLGDQSSQIITSLPLLSTF